MAQRHFLLVVSLAGCLRQETPPSLPPRACFRHTGGAFCPFEVPTLPNASACHVLMTVTETRASMALKRGRSDLESLDRPPGIHAP